MTACFLFSAAGSESPSFNYFHNFADPVSMPLCQRKWDLQQRPSTASAAFGSFKMRKFIKLRILYKILLTFHLLSFSHSRPPPTKHPRLEQFCTPNLLAQLQKKLWRTKQPNSNSPSTPLSLSPCAFVDSTRSPRVKTDRGHTIISNPLISGPWPRQHGDSQSKVLGPQSTDQQGRTVNLITSQIFGLQTSRSGFIQQSCQTLSPSYQRIFHPQVTATRESFFSV